MTLPFASWQGKRGTRRSFVDRLADPVDLPPVEIDDNLPRKQGDALAALVREDLDPLSVADLEARIAALDGEIARCRTRIDRAVNHRANADSIFKQ